MAKVFLSARDVTTLDAALPQITVAAPTRLIAQSDGTTAVFYADTFYDSATGNPGVPNVYVVGTGFTFDARGLLVGGAVTIVENYQPPSGNGIGQNQGSGFVAAVTGLSLTVPTLLATLRNGGSALPTLLAGSNTYNTQAATVTGSAGDDVFNILGPTSAIPFFPFGAPPGTDYSGVAVSGGGGQNTAVFSHVRSNMSDPLRSEVTITGGGGNELVAAPTIGVNATLVGIDKLQFLDGATFETNASAGAQAALAFEGIFGRLPDAINAGGFALAAAQSGTVAAAAQMLATPEATANTATLDNAGFVTRLYENMLGREPEATGLAGWQAGLDSGGLTRADVAARFAAGIEAQTANFTAFATGTVFAADPNAVEVLRAYETLLGRTPEKAALTFDTNRLNGGYALQDLYTATQRSAEFASRANPYGITAATPYASVYAAAHADPVNGIVGALVTSQGVGHQ